MPLRRRQLPSAAEANDRLDTDTSPLEALRHPEHPPRVQLSRMLPRRRSKIHRAVFATNPSIRRLRTYTPARVAGSATTPAAMILITILTIPGNTDAFPSQSAQTVSSGYTAEAETAFPSKATTFRWL